MLDFYQYTFQLQGQVVCLAAPQLCLIWEGKKKEYILINCVQMKNGTHLVCVPRAFLLGSPLKIGARPYI